MLQTLRGEGTSRDQIVWVMVEQMGKQAAGEKQGRKQWTLREFGGKPVWDWLELLLVPLLLGIIAAGLAAWFNAQQDARQNDIEDRRAQAEQQLAEQRAQDEALQAYLDQMHSLMLDEKLLESNQADSVYTLAQARTSTIIARLDPEHNRHVTRFLSNSGLSGRAGEETSISLLRQIDLSGTDLRSADLSNADLSNALLNNVTLTDADLVKANLSQVRLIKANLRHAFLVEVHLSDAWLFAADLHYADLTAADLQGANLSSWANFIQSTNPSKKERSKMERIGANVVGAGNLSEAADLSFADFTYADLSNASLRDANLSYASLQAADLSTESTFNLPDAPLGVLKEQGTNLTDANLTHAALQDANLSSAVLQNANLTNAALQSADLTDADLTDADLTDAVLRDTTLSDALLSGADLEGSTELTNEELEQQAKTLEGATMPNGQKYEDWVKSKGSVEDV